MQGGGVAGNHYRTLVALHFTIWTVTVDDGATKEFSVLRCDVTSGGDLKNDNDERIPFQWIDPPQDPVKEGK